MKKIIPYIVAILFILISCNPNSQKEITEIQFMAFDGTKCQTQELRDAINYHIYSDKKISNAYAVSNGSMTQFECDTMLLHLESEIQINNINNETIAKLMATGLNYKEAKEQMKKSNKQK